MKHHRIDIERNAELSLIVFATPLKQNKEVGDSGYRLIGPKAWGGSKNIASFDITETPLVNFIKKFSPEMVEAFKNEDKYLGLPITYEIKLTKGKDHSNLVLNESDQSFLLAGDKDIEDKDAIVHSLSMKASDLFRYVREYCAPKMIERIIS